MNPNITVSSNQLQQTFSFGIIYVYSIPDKQHRGRLKIGSATVSSSSPTQEEVISAAHSRISQQTKTADVKYNLEHAALAVTNDNQYFSDTDVHDVLIRSGFSRKSENTKNHRSEWFEISLETAKNAITATMEGREALKTVEKTGNKNVAFPFRPNQREAIDHTNKVIKQKRKHFLWNAKMRFGKTSAAMQVAKENGFNKVLIVTHRPSVSADWYDDFSRVFSGTNYEYSSKTKGERVQKRLSEGKPFIYFASLQDLRLSVAVVSDEMSGSKSKGFKKNQEIFDTIWDMVIVDEAHEGTQSNLGDTTLSKIPNNFMLELSGTPFNIIHKREEDEVYTWDYVMEQYEKTHWDENYPGLPNPYAELPALAMFTYDIDNFSSQIGNLGGFADQLDGAFRFHEFFRVEKDSDGNDSPNFVHKEMVNKFLDLLVNDKLNTKFPYASNKYRSYNKHSLWLLPNRTNVIEAMQKLLKAHPVFSKFGIVNISGDAKEDDSADTDAKTRVRSALENNEYTITLTGQRLTTGASIPEWTAVFMLSDTSSATTYLQTAFRCQTPARIDGKLKTQGYVFDFAPDRTLKLVAEAIELNHKSGKTNSPEQRQAMGDFLNFCPIIAAESGKMKPYDVSNMLLQLKKAIIERVSRNGFDDPSLYNDELMQLDELEIGKFNNLREIVGSSTSERTNEINVNELGMDKLEAQKAEEAEHKKKQKQQLTIEEKEQLRLLKEAREQKNSAISILRAVSIRMPMMVYGADISIREDITLQKFIDLIDDESWREFMPAGLSKKAFGEFTKYYDEEVFRGVAHNIRAKAFDNDELLPAERIQAIAEVFGTFKNPDKETVLTPWNVVNMQFALTLGGSDFRSIVKGKPEWNTEGRATGIWSSDETTILEINSKSGLYPLLAAYNMYSRQLIKSKKPEDKISRHLWNEILANNIYVLCKSPMAKTITERTLAGYRKTKMNIVYIEDLVKKLRQEGEYKGYNVIKELQDKFGLEGIDMKFTAVVGNPPYQANIEGRGDQPPVYNYFLETAYQISDLVSMIHPARFLFNAGATSKQWNHKMLNDEYLQIKLYQQNSALLFPNTDIKGGVVITLRDKNNKTGGLGGRFLHFTELNTILDKVKCVMLNSIGDIMVSNTSYKYKEAIYIENPYLRERVSGGSVRYLSSSVFDNFKEIMFDTRPKSDERYAEVYGRQNSHRTTKFIKEKYLNPPNNYTGYKVFVPASNGSGEIGEPLSTPLIGYPLVGHTETFISIGNFDNKNEAKNLLKYLKTKFSRTMLGTRKITQSNKSKDVWSNVPIQDFTNNSDIDWSKSIPEIDKQLYKKYSLTGDEINFIETRVKPME